MYQNNPLSRLGPGQAARVTALEAQGSMRRRLQDLGLTPGALVECLYKSPLGDPRAYLIRGAVIALRQKDAEGVRTGRPFAASGEERRGESLTPAQGAGYGAY